MKSRGDPPRYARLTGTRLLVVEDEILVLLELESILRDAGAENIYLCRHLKDALSRIDEHELTAAVLDIRLGQDVVRAVVRALVARGIPFVFYTGQTETEPAPRDTPRTRILPKPALPHTVVQALAELL